MSDRETGRMQYYQLYGLNIRSEMPLSGILPGGGGEDVIIRRTAFELPPLERSLVGIGFRVDGDTVYFRWDRVGSFRIRAGNEVDCIPDDAVGDDILERFITGPVLGAILYQRQHLILHGSAVVIGGGVVAFLAESGWGKSTLAAHFFARGCPLMTDDIVAIRLGDDRHLVHPGIPEVRLWPDSVTNLGKNPEELPAEMPGSNKRAWMLDGEVRPLALRMVYLLDQAEEHAIRPVASAEAAIELIKHTYGVRLLRTISTQTHFHHCATIARTVPIRRLYRHLSFDRLPELCDLIIDDLAQYGLSADESTLTA